MQFGVSSSCFYPLETEKSLALIGEMGIKTAEVFFNSPMELNGSIFENILQIKKYYSIDISSVHPCTSSCEPFFFFSEYERRFYDLLDFYKRYMDCCVKLGAKILIIHGMRTVGSISDEQYFERFGKICSVGKEFGITVAQENVSGFSSGDPAFLKKMKAYLGEDFKLNFDLKQMHRCLFNENDFFDDLIDSVVNVHISDSTPTKDCLPPGEGNYDLYSFVKRLLNSGYDGNCIIELYRSNYEKYNQIKKSYDYLCGLKI